MVYTLEQSASRIFCYVHDSIDGSLSRVSNLADNSIEAATPTRARDSQWIIDASFVHLVMPMYRNIPQNLGYDGCHILCHGRDQVGKVEVNTYKLTKLELSLHILRSLTLPHSHEIK